MVQFEICKEIKVLLSGRIREPIKTKNKRLQEFWNTFKTSKRHQQAPERRLVEIDIRKSENCEFFSAATIKPIVGLSRKL